ncbi:S-adenosylmethionine decarboxylase family protein [Chitinophaga sp. Hz27]|uniref:S-adenosylmethionine decarboxylase family protein n=1 Tax=Chitinophaga sp. Hz27 TaxID=3347169 RepID=UPI0035D8D8E1
MSTNRGEYSPGLHLLATIYSQRTTLLKEATAWHAFICNIIAEEDLTDVGNNVHNFPNGGFTAVYCLTESHISIHTWPEYGLCTCDVFLSNFRRDNSDKTTRIMEKIRLFFEADRIEMQSVKR